LVLPFRFMRERSVPFERLLRLFVSFNLCIRYRIAIIAAMAFFLIKAIMRVFAFIGIVCHATSSNCLVSRHIPTLHQQHKVFMLLRSSNMIISHSHCSQLQGNTSRGGLLSDCVSISFERTGFSLTRKRIPCGVEVTTLIDPVHIL
jgi:hypothetical protein